jgi:hypothetical protein
MKKNYVTLCFAASLPFVAATAFAQTQAAPKPAAEDAYTLKVPTAPASQVSGTPYEIKGTSISGATAETTAPILTAPTGDAAPYKTESGVYLYPTLFVGMGYNDNLQSAATNKVSSSLVNVSPQLIAEMKNKGDRYTALVSLNKVNYADSSPDNSSNSEFKIAGDNYFSARARAAWALGQVRSTDPRGSNNRPISAEPDRWTSNNVDARFIYGAPEAMGRFELDLGSTNKTYDNNRAFTSVADVAVGSFATRAFYRLGTRSLALAEFRNAKANYASALSNESNTEKRYYVGLTWDATAATSGIFKLGRMTKDFDAAGRTGFEGASWEGTLRWTPLTYSAVDLLTSRATSDSSGFGNYNLVTTNNLSWNHKWTGSLSTRAALGVVKTEFGGTTRSDSATNYTLTMDYSVLRWLKVGVDWAGTDNTSNVPTSEFKRNVTMFTLNASL